MGNGSTAFDVLTTVLMDIQGSWDVMPYQLMKCCAHIFSVSTRLDPEEEGGGVNRPNRNVGNQLPADAA
jgi:hypothetical protein